MATPTGNQATPTGEALTAEIEAQGTKVRELKTSGADKVSGCGHALDTPTFGVSVQAVVDVEVKQLLALKTSFKALTGQDFAAGGSGRKSKGGKPSKAAGGGGGASKKEEKKAASGQKPKAKGTDAETEEEKKGTR